MARGVSFKLGDVEYWMVCNAEAYFAILDKYGGNFFDALTAPGTDGYHIAIDIAVILAEQGELCRRHLGYEPVDMLTADTIQLVIAPTDIGRFKEIIANAVMRGLNTSEDKKKSGPVDLGLAELEKKTTII